jgi:1,4-dihydroxy-6-naphthoate synthase
MAYRLGFSTCPNDTFIFDAMVNGKIDTEGLTFEPVLADVEELNQRAFQETIDITKLSYFTYGQLTDSYILLTSGSALGNNCGPLVIAKENVTDPSQEAAYKRIAIPGRNTTANFLFSYAFPQATNKQEMLFSEIEDAVLTQRTDWGVIIHENRFTYQQKGLKKVIDLGKYWEQSTGCPIPLGGIAVHRDIPEEVQQKINRVLQRSVRYAFDNPASATEYVRQYAQEMDEEVMYKHINLYVNSYTEDLGETGREAVSTMLQKAHDLKLLSLPNYSLFIR